MSKSLIVLAILSTASAPLYAQSAPATNVANPAKPLTVKKRVCYQTEADSYSRLGERKVCKTIEVPAPATSGGGQTSPKAPAQPQQGGR